MPMIPPDSSWISPKRMPVSTFTQGRTQKPSVSPLGPSNQQPLTLDRALSTTFTHQDGESDKFPSPLESTHGRGNHDEETENLTASMVRRLLKETSHSHRRDAMSVEGTLIIAAAADRAVDIYGDKK